jgi:uncharacterized protein YoxC
MIQGNDILANGWFAVLVMAVAVAFVVLVIAMVRTLIEIRKTAYQARQFFVQLNKDAPLILNYLQGTSKNVRGITDETKDGISHALVLFHAVGDVGHTLGTMHHTVLWQAKRLGNRVDILMAGMKAMYQSIRRRSYSSKIRSPQKPNNVWEP